MLRQANLILLLQRDTGKCHNCCAFIGSGSNFLTFDFRIALSFHRDGPNCSDISYKHTLVFSKLVVWRQIVYRFTIILYSRASCSYWLIKNRKARKLRRLLRSSKIETNGIDYRSFNLSSNMSAYKGKVQNVNDDVPIFRIKPSQDLLTKGFFSDIPNSIWGHNDFHLKEMKWVEFPLLKNQPSSPTLPVIFVPEFQNRSAFVSLFASAINNARDKVSLSKNQVLELVYVALLSTSNLNFFYVLQEMLNNYITDHQWDHPFFFFKETCHRKGLKIRGGRNPRFQGQSEENLPSTKSQLLNQLEVLGQAVRFLNNGELLNSEGVYVHDSKVYSSLKGVGNVAAISFPSLCCFVGLGETKYAIQTAKQAPLNNSSRNNYFSSLVEALTIPGDKGFPPSDPSYYLGMLKAIASSLGETVSTLENSVCSHFRKHKRYDNFVLGQELYTFSTTDYNVYFQKFGTAGWFPKDFIFKD